MADLLANGLAWLTEQRKEHLTTTAIYSRTGEDDLTLSVSRARTSQTVESMTGVSVEVREQDWLVDADALGVYGTPTPKRNDRILAEGGIYEVMDMAGQGPWRYTDSRRATFRIHTKYVGSES